MLKMKKAMKNIITTLLLVCLFTGTVFAQDTTATKKSGNSNKSLLGYFIINDGKPVSNPYESDYLIDNYTNVIPSAQTLEMVIQHRFGSLNNGMEDFLGIYGAANTRLALNYAITDWVQVSLGTTKTFYLVDLGVKFALLKQSRNNNSPVDVTFIHNFSIDCREDDNFGEDPQFSNRMAFFNELLVTRKFTNWLTLSVGGSLSHLNQVDSLYNHDKFAMHFLGRVKVSPQGSIIVNYDLPFKGENMKEWSEIKERLVYNFGIGYEIATATHAFQVFVGSGNYLVPQYNVMKNGNKFFVSTENIFIGFNITRQWGF